MNTSSIFAIKGVLLVSIGIFGILGNILSILVLSRSRYIMKNSATWVLQSFPYSDGYDDDDHHQIMMLNTHDQHDHLHDHHLDHHNNNDCSA